MFFSAFYEHCTYFFYPDTRQIAFGQEMFNNTPYTVYMSYTLPLIISTLHHPPQVSHCQADLPSLLWGTGL